MQKKVTLILVIIYYDTNVSNNLALGEGYNHKTILWLCIIGSLQPSKNFFASNSKILYTHQLRFAKPLYTYTYEVQLWV